MNDVGGDDANLDERTPSSYWRRLARILARRVAAFVLKLGRRVAPIVSHGIAMNVFILFMALTERVLNFTMSHSATLFDVVPVRYLVQTVDVAMFVGFTASVWREYR